MEKQISRSSLRGSMQASAVVPLESRADDRHTFRPHARTTAALHAHHARGRDQTVSGVIDVLDTAVTMEIELPGVLGLLAGGLKDRLQKAGLLLLTKK